MAPALTPAKVVCLAASFATKADIDSLTTLTAQYSAILRKELVLRILLTYLPETTRSSNYVPFLQWLSAGEPDDAELAERHLDTSLITDLSDEDAIREVKKLGLVQLARSGILDNGSVDPIVSFLLLRSYRVDEEAGMLSQVPDLLVPFLQQSPGIRTLLISTVLPLLRRDNLYYPQRAGNFQYTLSEFQNLPDRTAIDYLLAETGKQEDDQELVGRDLKGLIGPWLHNVNRWKDNAETADEPPSPTGSTLSCPGWEHVLEWLTLQASKSWRVAFSAISQWDGPSDIDLGDDVTAWLQESQQQYLDQTYARAALACAYLIPEATLDALDAGYRIGHKIRSLMDQETGSSLSAAASELSPVLLPDTFALDGPKASTYLRNDLLSSSNTLTNPSSASSELLMALILSAYLLTRAGIPCSVRRAGDLAFIQDPAEQKAELVKMIRGLSSRGHRGDDEFWSRSRQEVLWLHNWGIQRGTNSGTAINGIFGTVPIDYIETEMLKVLLSNSRYTLARSLYEDVDIKPLSAEIVRDTVQDAALSAFDNASNPNRTRGGLKKCDEIIHAFPKTMNRSLPATQRIEALLKATHALSDYRLVLKHGEPFSPVVMRVHSDPISIVEKVLEQNPKAYTRLQEFLEMGTNLVKAGLTGRSDRGSKAWSSEEQSRAIPMAEKRIVAMCIEAALREDDFETAYSYVMSRLDRPDNSAPLSRAAGPADEWSWKAALKAGQYVRTMRSQKPTHLGTASGNLEIRHLEQRIECLATALRISPPSQLQEVLKTFRRCEEQLDSAIKEEAAREEAMDIGNLGHIPGAFDQQDPQRSHPPRNMTAGTAARQTEEAPMSLFDLSRATARVAQRNFTALSSLQGLAQGITRSDSESESLSKSQSSDTMGPEAPRSRKRDQLREAATGTLVSGVGWLIGANVNRQRQDEQQ